MKKNRPNQKIDYDFLKEHYKEFTDEELGEMFDCRTNTIAQGRIRYGLKKKRHNNRDFEKEYVKNNFNKKSYKDMQEYLNLPLGTIYNLAHRLGLKTRDVISKKLVETRRLLEEKGYIVNPEINRNETRCQYLNFGDDRLIYFRFKAHSKGSNTKNASYLGMGNKGIAVLFLSSKRHHALQALLYEYPRLIDYKMVWQRLVRNIIGANSIANHKTPQKIKYKGENYLIKHFVRINLDKV